MMFLKGKEMNSMRLIDVYSLQWMRRMHWLRKLKKVQSRFRTQTHRSNSTLRKLQVWNKNLSFWKKSINQKRNECSNNKTKLMETDSKSSQSKMRFETKKECWSNSKIVWLPKPKKMQILKKILRRKTKLFVILKLNYNSLENLMMKMQKLNKSSISCLNRMDSTSKSKT